MNIDRIAKVVEEIEPYHWKKHNLTVIGDGYLEDGTRVHVVKEPFSEKPVVLSNAIVVSEQQLLSSES